MRTEQIGDATLYLADCKDILPTLDPVDAVVTDPPYGTGMVNRGIIGSDPTDQSKRNSRKNKYGHEFYGRQFAPKDWNNKLAKSELMQAVVGKGKYAIIFGGNYYNLPPCSKWLIWDKQNDETDFADAELAWTNLKGQTRIKRYLWNGFCIQNGTRRGPNAVNYEQRGHHPTQKPLGVMEWCIEQLPDGVDTILDPFMGSGTTGVAALWMGKKFIGIEREADYFETACKRILAASLDRRLPFDEVGT